jgi:hypothetical protein
VQSIIGIDSPVRMMANGATVPPRLNGPILYHLQNEDITDGQADSKTAHNDSNLLRTAENLHDSATLITQKLVEKLSSALGIPEGVLISIACCMSMVSTLYLQLSSGIGQRKSAGLKLLSLS